jgi:hypothetical protein
MLLSNHFSLRSDRPLLVQRVVQVFTYLIDVVHQVLVIVLSPLRVNFRVVVCLERFVHDALTGHGVMRGAPPRGVACW